MPARSGSHYWLGWPTPTKRAWDMFAHRVLCTNSSCFCDNQKAAAEDKWFLICPSLRMPQEAKQPGTTTADPDCNPLQHLVSLANRAPKTFKNPALKSFLAFSFFWTESCSLPLHEYGFLRLIKQPEATAFSSGKDQEERTAKSSMHDPKLPWSGPAEHAHPSGHTGG